MTVATVENMAAAASTYAATGWPVLPLHGVLHGICTCWRGSACRSHGKHPVFDTGDEHAAATTDRALIQEWWGRWPGANVGIVTGRASGLVVLDIDPAKGGAGSLARLFPNGTPCTREVVTGSGGTHLYFVHPGTAIRCRVGFLAGLDIRGDGGLVVAPPSRHKQGTIYRFSDNTKPIAAMPSELVAALASVKPAAQTAAKVRAFRGALSPYAEVALERESAALATQPAGAGRHTRLYAASAALGELIAGGMLPRPLVEERLHEACERNGMVGEGRETEIEKTISAGIEAGMRSPRRGGTLQGESRPTVRAWEHRPEVSSWKS